ncbi:PQQ-like beta-propeller repeat protein, partial [archaeon]|nr:PQQ-like beta-propeller repeat protein [archaeon]
MFHGNLKHTGLSPYNTSHVNGTVKWTFEAGGAIESSPAIGADGTIYVGSHDNKLYAINPDGTVKWQFIVGDPEYLKEWDNWKGILSTPAIGSDGTIYFTSISDFLFAINPDGTEKWRFSIAMTSDSWSSPAIGPDATIYIGSARKYSEGAKADIEIGGKLYAIKSDGTEKWNFPLGSDVNSNPAIDPDGTIYVGSWHEGVGRIYAINSDGREKWYFKTEKWIESSPAIGPDGTVYAGSYEGNIYAINSDGTEKWHFKTGDGVSATPAIGKDGTVYIGSWDYNFYAINPDGTEKWRFQTEAAVEGVSSSAVIGADGTIYFGSNNGKFYALTPNRSEKWHYDTTSSITSSPAIGSDGTVYVGSWGKKLYAFGGSPAKKDLENKSEVVPLTKEETTTQPTITITSPPQPTSPTKDMTIIYLLGAVAIVIVGGIVIALKKR